MKILQESIWECLGKSIGRIKKFDRVVIVGKGGKE